MQVPRTRSSSLLLTVCFSSGLYLAEVARAASDRVDQYKNHALGFQCRSPGATWRFSEEEIWSDLPEDTVISDVGGVTWLLDEDRIEMAVVAMTLRSQIAPAHLAEMAEEMHLAHGRRILGDVVDSGQYPAFLAKYVAPDLHSIFVYIVAGQKAFILTVEGVEGALEKHQETFKGFIGNFHPLPESEKSAGRSPRSPDRSTTDPPFPNLYRGRGLGFTINYAKGWNVERIEKNTLRIMGPEGSDASQIQVLVSFQGSVEGVTTAESALAAVVEDIYAEYPKAEFQSIRAYGLAGGLLNGHQCVAEFWQEWDRVRQWLGVVQNENGEFYFMLAKGPSEVMLRHSKTIDKMMDSLSPTR